MISLQEMPTFEIYSDQLLTIVNQELSYFDIEVTNSMVNNYVKHKVMPLPIKKKYNRTHIAYLILISLLKTTFSLEEIKQYFDNYPPEEEYDTFRYIFESLWHKAEHASTKLEPDDISDNIEGKINLSAQLHLLMSNTVISKWKATRLLMQKGGSHATTTSR